jgi:hypothetical protein
LHVGASQQRLKPGEPERTEIVARPGSEHLIVATLAEQELRT